MGINPTLVLNYTGTTDNGNMILAGSNAALVLNTPNNVNYTGVISGATGSFTKGSIGTLTLSNANTYGGATTISGGRHIARFCATAPRPPTFFTILGTPVRSHSMPRA